MVAERLVYNVLSVGRLAESANSEADPMATSIDDQRRVFDEFCCERFTAEHGDSTSKTICRAKGEKIVHVLKEAPEAQKYGPKFKFCVKKRGCQLTSYPPLGLKDVLCLPANKKVG